MGVKSLSSVIAAAYGLLDYKLGNPSTSEFNKNKSGRKNGKDNGLKFKPKVNDSQSKNGQKNMGCFICDGPHRVNDCPKREMLNAIVADGSREGSDSDITRVNPLQLLNAIRVEVTLPTRTSTFSSRGGLLKS